MNYGSLIAHSTLFITAGVIHTLAKKSTPAHSIALRVGIAATTLLASYYCTYQAAGMMGITITAKMASWCLLGGNLTALALNTLMARKNQSTSKAESSAPTQSEPLLPLQNIILGAKHELRKTVSPVHFIKDDDLLRRAHASKKELADIIRTGLDDLLDVSLLTWCKVEDSRDANATERATALTQLLKACKRKSIIDVITARVDLLNQAIQLSERLKDLKNKNAFLKIKIRHIMSALDKSELRKALLADEELKAT